MEKVKNLVVRNNLRIIDAIVLKKRFIGMVDHYVLYGGTDEYNQPIFVANYKNGVQVVPHEDMVKYTNMMEPDKIVYFEGNDYEREMAIERAKSRIGEKAYDYLSNNCEHFVTYVHTGQHKSQQVADAGVGLMAGGAFVAAAGLASKNKTAGYVGLGALLLGALLKYGFNDSED